MRAHVFDPVPSLREHARAWIPPELDQLIAACLAKEPGERPQDARALAKALGAIPIPPDQAWTEELAQMWWSNLQLTRANTNESTAEDGRLLVPQRVTTTRVEVPSPSQEARTIEGRRNARTL